MATLTIEIPDHLAHKLAEHQYDISKIFELGLENLPTTSRQLSEEVFDFFSQGPSSAEIAAFAPSDAIQAQIRTLLDKNRQGTIRPEELDDLNQIGSINDFVSILKIRAQKSMQ